MTYATDHEVTLRTEAAGQRKQGAQMRETQTELRGHAKQGEKPFLVMSNRRQALCRAIQLINTLLKVNFEQIHKQRSNVFCK